MFLFHLFFFSFLVSFSRNLRAQPPDVQAAYVKVHSIYCRVSCFDISQSVPPASSFLYSTLDSALAKKQAGNQAYKSGNYSLATQLYSEAIGMTQTLARLNTILAHFYFCDTVD